MPKDDETPSARPDEDASGAPAIKPPAAYSSMTDVRGFKISATGTCVGGPRLPSAGSARTDTDPPLDPEVSARLDRMLAPYEGSGPPSTTTSGGSNNALERKLRAEELRRATDATGATTEDVPLPLAAPEGPSDPRRTPTGPMRIPMRFEVPRWAKRRADGEATAVKHAIATVAGVIRANLAHVAIGGGLAGLIVVGLLFLGTCDEPENHAPRPAVIASATAPVVIVPRPPPRADADETTTPAPPTSSAALPAAPVVPTSRTIASAPLPAPLRSTRAPRPTPPPPAPPDDTPPPSMNFKRDPL